MRDMAVLLPDVAEDFAADAALARLAVGHEPWLVDRTATPRPPSTRGTSSAFGVDPQAGLRHPLQARDDALALGRVLHRRSVSMLAGRPWVVARRRSPRCSPPAAGARPAPPSAWRTASRRRRASPRWRCGCGSACRRWDRSWSWFIASPHQLALVTPGISPAWASSRRQIRHSPNLRYTDARPAAAPAAGVAPHLELGLALLLLDERLLGHYCCPSRRNGKPKASSRALPSALVRAVVTMVMSMPSGCVDLVVVDLGEDQLLGDAERVVAPAVERVGRQAAEVADAGDGEADQPVEELPHAVAAQGDLGADGVALAELEAGDRLLGLGDERLLAGDDRRGRDRTFEQLTAARRRRPRPC